MINDIVEMIYEEAKAKDCEHPSMELYELLREINNKVWTLAGINLEKKKRRGDDEKKAKQ